VNFGTALMLNDQLDSSFVHLQKAYNETLRDKDWHPVFSMFFGRLQFLMGRHDIGISYLHQSIEIFEDNKDHYSTSDACRIIASCFKEINEIDSSIYYGRRALEEARSIDYKTSILLASKLLAEAYESTDLRQAIYFRKVFDSTNDVLYGANKVKGLQKTLSDEEDRQRRIEAERIAYQNRLKEYSLIAGLAIILLIAFILFRNNLQKKKANVLLQHQKEKIESTLQELKLTQGQLIQSEKMASLGELTAGIAHEIQNPLNFVNNFSEVNNELISELVVEVDKGNTQEVKTIANDLKQNLEKIIHHGKRADGIVKGMLQHSRSGSGRKELTDINALCDEYLRLAYHGMRAKDKFFTAKYQTDLDDSIDKVNIVPQDIGRVMLNLINNAFYAVDEKTKRNIPSYKPTVTVTTRKVNDKVEVRVADNGNGIPQRVADKIFQPFFTTKPAGQGTGLGLSLSYDIIKVHDGEIKVETKEGEGSEFIIQLPAAPFKLQLA
jgi:two-component system, NtrC family, sensor kinase